MYVLFAIIVTLFQCAQINEVRPLGYLPAEALVGRTITPSIGTFIAAVSTVCYFVGCALWIQLRCVGISVLAFTINSRIIAREEMFKTDKSSTMQSLISASKKLTHHSNRQKPTLTINSGAQLVANAFASQFNQ